MQGKKTLAIVLAGGKGSRLELLTQHRAKPAVPYGGTHRLIDFSLSNCANSGIQDVWVIGQYNPESISEHLAGGRPWDLDRTNGGLQMLQPRQSAGPRSGFHQGTAHSLWQQVPLIRKFDPAAVVVVSADAIYRLDYAQIVSAHHEHSADLTMVTTQVQADDASRYGIVELKDEQDDQSLVSSYTYKPEQPASTLAANEVFIFSPAPLLELLEELGPDHDDDQDDLGHQLLPRLVRRGNTRQWRMRDYWRDVGTVQAYWRSHQDLLGANPEFELRTSDWPILTRGDLSAPVRIGDATRLDTCLLSSGAHIDGAVEHSVIGRGATVEAGALVSHSVLLPGARVASGARVHRAVIDEGSIIEAGAQVGEPEGEIALVGSDCTVTPDHQVPAGGRYRQE